MASACEWASTRARPAACTLKCALARAARRALAFARRCRLGLDVTRGLGVGGGDVLRGGKQVCQSVQLVHLGASACTAATVTTYYSNATRGRRSGARLRSGLRRFASPPLESRYPPLESRYPPRPLPFHHLFSSRTTGELQGSGAPERRLFGAISTGLQLIRRW